MSTESGQTHFHSAGLDIETLCDRDGKPFTRGSRRLILVGRKTR
jgi:hypothetical protein